MATTVQSVGLRKFSPTMSKDPKQILSDFDKALDASYPELPGGGDKEKLAARQRIRPLIEAGKRQEASDALRGEAGLFSGARTAEANSLSTKRPEWVEAASKEIALSRSKLEALQQRQAGASTPAEKSKLAESITTTTDLLKTQEDQYAVLTRVQQDFAVSDPFGSQRDNLKQYIADLKVAGEVFGDTIGGFGNTGFSGLDSKLKIGGARLSGDLFEGALAGAREENSVMAAEANYQLSQSPSAEKAKKLQEELDFYEEIEGSLDEQISKIRDATREEERKLEISRQAATIKEAYDDGGASARSSIGRYGFGRSEGEKLVNQTRGTLGDLDRSLAETPDAGVGSARALGQLTERLQSSKQGILSVEDRMNRAMADRLNLEYDISQQAVKQREEATKRLALASREDQLRSAAAAAFLRNNGKQGFTMQEFQYFSQDTRGAISNYSPGSVKGLDDTERDQNESRAKLDREIGLLAVSLGTLRKTYDELRPKAEGKGGELGRNSVPGASGPQLSNAESRLQLNMGEVRINLDMAPHINTIVNLLKPGFTAELGEAINSLRRELTRGRAPDTAPAAGTY